MVATTRPVYEFTARLCQGTDLQVCQLVTESVSCLHDYTLKTAQMRLIEGAELLVINGAGLEDFLEDALDSAHHVVDASSNMDLLEGHHDHDHDVHAHTEDPHTWLSPEYAKTMAENICHQLIHHYPQYTSLFSTNLTALLADLDALQVYGENKLSGLSYREMITFHDGFGYFAESFHLEILKAVEEESGSEASAQALVELIGLVQEHNLPAIFTEINGADSAARVVANETGANVFALDMAMAGSSYFDSMYYNIDTIWEALQ